MRKLVKAVQIDHIDPIEGADRIEVATVLGWKVVVPKGMFNEGGFALFFEIDSFLPSDNPIFAHLAKSGTVELDGVEGVVLRTARLRGQVSQGLLKEFPKDLWHEFHESYDDTVIDRWAEENGVKKWEDPIPVGSPDIIGGFPGHIRKTDSERVQNLSDEFFLRNAEFSYYWFATEKIDGSSATFYKLDDGVLRAASRNYEVKIEGHFKTIADRYNLDEIIKPRDWIQGEIYGEKIQGNPLKVKGIDFAVFEFNSPDPDADMLSSLKFVPVYCDLVFPKTIQEAVDQVDGIKSLINPERRAEGVVWWCQGTEEGLPELGNRRQFKVISNEFLIKEKK